MIDLKSEKAIDILKVYILIFLVIFGPLLLGMLAGFVGEFMDCNINEGGTDPCIRLGIPFGEILNPMAVLPWLSILSFPFGVLLCIVWTIYWVTRLIFKKHK